MVIFQRCWSLYLVLCSLSGRNLGLMENWLFKHNRPWSTGSIAMYEIEYNNMYIISPFTRCRLWSIASLLLKVVVSLLRCLKIVTNLKSELKWQSQYSCAKRTFLNLPFILLLWNWSPFISQFDINAFIIELKNSGSYCALRSDTFVAKECYAETQALCVSQKDGNSCIFSLSLWFLTCWC